MIIEVINDWSMCSTLTIGMLGEVHVCGPEEYAPETETYDSLWRSFEDARARFEGDEYGEDSVSDYAFVVCSTSNHQPVTESHLRRIGFWSSERVSKEKNSNSDVKVWVISVRDFLKAYEGWKAG